MLSKVHLAEPVIVDISDYEKYIADKHKTAQDVTDIITERLIVGSASHQQWLTCVGLLPDI